MCARDGKVGLIERIHKSRIFQYFIESEEIAIRCILLPQPLEPRRRGFGVDDRVLDIDVSEVILDQPSIPPLVRQGVATAMP